jgi:hypothetical protein
VTESIDGLHAEPGGHDRRAFVKRIVAGTAFAVPLVTSFDMAALRGSTAYAQGNQSS